MIPLQRIDSKGVLSTGRRALPLAFLALIGAAATGVPFARAAKAVDVNVIVDMTPEGRKVPPPTPEHPAYYLPVIGGYQELGSVVAGERPPTPRDVEHLLAVSLAKQGYRVVKPGPNTNSHGELTYADGTVVTVPAHPDRLQPIVLDAPGNIPLTAAMIDALSGPYSAHAARMEAAEARAAHRTEPPSPLAQALRAVDPVHGPVMGGVPSLILAFQWGYINPDLDDFGGGGDVTQQAFFNQNQMLALVAGNTLEDMDFDFFARQIVTQAAKEDRYFIAVTAFDYDAYTKGRKKVILWQAKMSVPSTGLWFDSVLPALAEAGGPFFGRETKRPKQLFLPVTPEGRVTIGTPVVKDYQEVPAPPPPAPPEKK